MYVCTFKEARVYLTCENSCPFFAPGPSGVSRRPSRATSFSRNATRAGSEEGRLCPSRRSAGIISSVKGRALCGALSKGKSYTVDKCQFDILRSLFNVFFIVALMLEVLIFSLPRIIKKRISIHRLEVLILSSPRIIKKTYIHP